LAFCGRSFANTKSVDGRSGHDGVRFGPRPQNLAGIYIVSTIHPPQKGQWAPTKELVSLRLSRATLATFRALGPVTAPKSSLRGAKRRSNPFSLPNNDDVWANQKPSRAEKRSAFRHLYHPHPRRYTLAPIHRKGK
jgi:hypothetical protein